MENKKIQDKVTVLKAITSGDLQTKLSIPFMGLGVFLKGQKIKGCLIFLLEVAFFLYMATSGIHALSLLPSLGDQAQGKVWNEAKQIFEYSAGDNSQLILLFGVSAFSVTWDYCTYLLSLDLSYYGYYSSNMHTNYN